MQSAALYYQGIHLLLFSQVARNFHEVPPTPQPLSILRPQSFSEIPAHPAVWLKLVPTKYLFNTESVRSPGIAVRTIHRFTGGSAPDL
jgi:hypothetical protein